MASDGAAFQVFHGVRVRLRAGTDSIKGGVVQVDVVHVEEQILTVAVCERGFSVETVQH